MSEPDHFNLDQVIARLELEDPNKRVRIGFTYPHSYRGDYYELAFETCEAITVGEMLAAAEAARGATFEGWKGGDYTMDGSSLCWLVPREGTSKAETLGALLLDFLLADQISADTLRGRSYSEAYDEELAARERAT